MRRQWNLLWDSHRRPASRAAGCACAMAIYMASPMVRNLAMKDVENPRLAKDQRHEIDFGGATRTGSITAPSWRIEKGGWK